MSFNRRLLVAPAAALLIGCSTTQVTMISEDVNRSGNSVVMDALLEVCIRDSTRVIFYPHAYTIQKKDSVWRIKGIGFVKSSAFNPSFLKTFSIDAAEVLWLKQVERKNYDWLAAAVGIPVVGFTIYKIVEFWIGWPFDF